MHNIAVLCFRHRFLFLSFSEVKNVYLIINFSTWFSCMSWEYVYCFLIYCTSSAMIFLCKIQTILPAKFCFYMENLCFLRALYILLPFGVWHSALLAISRDRKQFFASNLIALWTILICTCLSIFVGSLSIKYVFQVQTSAAFFQCTVIYI